MKKIILLLALCVLSSPAQAFNVTSTIASGQSISSSIDLTTFAKIGNQKAVGVLMPPAWTTASLIFLVSADGGQTYTELFDGNGNEYVVNVAANEYVLLDPDVFGYFTNLQVQSVNYGTPPSVPVAQGSSRVLTFNVQIIN